MSYIAYLRFPVERETQAEADSKAGKATWLEGMKGGGRIRKRMETKDGKNEQKK